MNTPSTDTTGTDHPKMATNVNVAAVAGPAVKISPVDKLEKSFTELLQSVAISGDGEARWKNCDSLEGLGAQLRALAAIEEFFAMGRNTERYFVSKRTMLRKMNPEIVVQAVNNALKIDLIRKEKVITKNKAKMLVWEQQLASARATSIASLNGNGGPSTTTAKKTPKSKGVTKKKDQRASEGEVSSTSSSARRGRGRPRGSTNRARNDTSPRQPKEKIPKPKATAETPRKRRKCVKSSL